MKKLITITSILAAGTLCANAGTYLITLDDLTSDASSGTISYTASTGYVSGTDLFENLTISSTNRSTVTTILNLNLTALQTVTDYTQLIDYRTSSSSSTSAIGLAATSTGLVLSWQSSTYDSTGNLLSWADLGANKYTVDGVDYVLVAFEATGRNITGSDVQGTDLFQISSDASSIASYSFGYSGLTSSNTYTTLYLDNSGSYITGATLYSGIAATSDMLSSAAALKVVPEPSFFGLLAGTLALGLAGTRRRRGNAK